jgi:hypothetical protein
VQPGHHGPDRRAHDVGDLAVGESLDVGQVDRDAELFGQLLQGVLDVGVGQPLERLALRRLQARGGVLGRPGELPVLNVLGAGPLRLTLPLAVGVDERVGQDPEQPRLEVGARLELVEGRIRLGERLLNQVLRVGRVARHAHGRGVQLVEVGQHVLLEAFAPLRECLRDRTHPLSGRRVGQPHGGTVWAGGYILHHSGLEGSRCRAVIERPVASCDHGNCNAAGNFFIPPRLRVK